MLYKSSKISSYSTIVDTKNASHFSTRGEDLLNLEAIHRQIAKLASFSALQIFERYGFLFKEI